MAWTQYLVCNLSRRYGIMTARVKAISGTRAPLKLSPQHSGALVPCASRAAFPSREFLSAVILLFLDSVHQGEYANQGFELACCPGLQFLGHYKATVRKWDLCHMLGSVSVLQLQGPCIRCSLWSIISGVRLLSNPPMSDSIPPSTSLSYTPACFPSYAGFHLRSLRLCWEIHWYGNTHQHHYLLLFSITHM